MKKDLKNFLRDKGKNVAADTGAEDILASEEAAGLMDKAKRYEGKSEEQLMSELLSSVDADKKNGTFSAQALNDFASRASAMMNEEQRKKLNAIMEKLR